MTTPINFLPGTPIWMELFTSDIDKSVDFYTQLMGWTFTEPHEKTGGYRNIVSGTDNVAGCMVNDQPSSPDCWWIYLHSPQVDSVQSHAEEAGGQVLMPVMDVMDLGRAVVVGDPSGVPIGGW